MYMVRNKIYTVTEMYIVRDKYIYIYIYIHMVIGMCMVRETVYGMVYAVTGMYMVRKKKIYIYGDCNIYGT